MSAGIAELNRPLTPEEFEKAMHLIALGSSGDPEIAHSMADDTLCGQLRALGYGAGVDHFHRMTKWYA